MEVEVGWKGFESEIPHKKIRRMLFERDLYLRVKVTYTVKTCRTYLLEPFYDVTSLTFAIMGQQK